MRALLFLSMSAHSVHSMSIIASISVIYAVRMLGLFMLLPVLALHVDSLPGATALTIGIALGGYGLMQVLLQIPFATLSDRFGRRRMLMVGFALFVLGSVVAYAAQTIVGIIVGRMLQGAGAITGVLLAALGDWVPDRQRLRASACVGASIGLAFVLALVCAPLINSAWGLKGIFALNAIAALLVLSAMPWLLPDDVPHTRESVAARSTPPLVDLCAGIFLLHAVFTACFLIVPHTLVGAAGLPAEEHWQMYLKALGIAGLLALMLLHRRRSLHIGGIFVAALFVLSSGFVLAGAQTSVAVLFGLGVFFAGFFVLESVFPVLLMRRVDSTVRGTGTGYYSTAQFSGSFAGGLLGGLLLSYWSSSVVLYIISPLMLLWVVAFAISGRAGSTIAIETR